MKKLLKIKFVRDKHLYCNSGGGNIFRLGEIRDYLIYQEAIRIKYKNGTDFYDFPIEDMRKNCLWW